MKIYEFKTEFLTPAFLGNAEQKGQWRTPPLKSLLRQWWRVAYAADTKFNLNLEEMRRKEGFLFGNAWLDNEFVKSDVRLRLDRWDEGKLQSWQPLGVVKHPEVKNDIRSDIYLGFGPLTNTKSNAAIQVGESAALSIAFRDVESNLMERAIWLMDRFGTLGGRSRNGWGSFIFEPKNNAARNALANQDTPLRPWRDCLNFDWPHSIGKDDKGALIWCTGEFNDWKPLMKRMAEIKIGLRTQFKFTTGDNTPSPEERHWLSYPVTKHSVKAWGNNARLPNNLRFKVRKTQEGKLIGMIFHVPFTPPHAFNPNLKIIENIWFKVHLFLDQELKTRLGANQE